MRFQTVPLKQVVLTMSVFEVNVDMIEVSKIFPALFFLTSYLNY
jgi:hypothetical protein